MNWHRSTPHPILTELILTIDGEGTVHFINQVPPCLKGQEIEKYNNIYALLSPSSQRGIKKAIEQVFTTHQNIYTDLCVITPDKKEVWYSASFGFTSVEQRVIAVLRDVTEQKQSGDSIKKRAKEIKTVYEINQAMRNSLELEQIYDAFYGVSKR